MGYHVVSFEERIKENIRNYAIKNLYSIKDLEKYLGAIVDEYGVELLLTDRHGERAITLGNFDGFVPDVVNQPGEKLRICNRTVGHLYVKYDKVLEERKENAQKFVDLSLSLLARLGNEVYMHRESISYIEELELKLNKEHYQNKYGEKEDILTGVYSKNYMEIRMNVLDRAEMVPVAVLNININDWKFVYDKFGVDESDSLIQLVASIVMNEAKSEYIIGRIDGDVFLVLIPMAEENEAEDYAERIQKACLAYNENTVLAPSVAIGIVYKTNVEEPLKDKISDAEYEMFNNKLEIKSAPGYKERLERGLQK